MEMCIVDNFKLIEVHKVTSRSIRERERERERREREKREREGYM